jgi:molybdopterin-guanine dinucleotide biosynthesis protein A
MNPTSNYPTLLILAGGKSSRMGKPKGLLPFDNSFWILHQIENYIGNDVCIGLGFDYQLYFEAIPWLEKAVSETQYYNDKKIRVTINTTPEFGLFSTLQSVLKQVDNNQNLLIIPVDVPLLNSSEQEKMISIENIIVIPTYKNKNGHPVKLKPEYWNSLIHLNVADEDSRLDLQIKKRNASEISMIDVSDASCIKNLNTPKEWQEFINS